MSEECKQLEDSILRAERERITRALLGPTDGVWPTTRISIDGNLLRNIINPPSKCPTCEQDVQNE